MFKVHKSDLRSELRSAVSALAIAAGAFAAAGSANADPVLLNSSSGTYSLFSSTDTAIELVSGTTAYYVKNNVTWAPPANTLKLGAGDPAHDGSNAGISTTGSCVFNWDCGNAHAPTITVDSGATLTFAGRTTVNQSWYFGNVELQSALVSKGDLVFEFPGPTQSWGNPLVAFLGTNQFLGNMTLQNQAYVELGYSWSKAASVFGPNTNISLAANSRLDIYQLESSPLVMGGTISGTGTLNLYTGTLVINGANTGANPFAGSLVVSAAQTLVVGDASHSGAILGDPTHATATTLALTGSTSGGPILRGFGTIDMLVANSAAVVQPGYGSSKLGNLTVAAYTQDNTGTLKVEVSPDAVSGLHVLGNATLGGTLNVTIDAGNYATQIYNIVQVDGTMSGDFKSITTSSAVQGAIAAVTRTDHGYQVVTQVVQGKAATAPIVVGHLVDVNRLNNAYFIGSLYDRINVDSPRGDQQIGRNKYVWVEGFGRQSSVSRNDVGYHATTAGFTAGAEYRTESNKVVGVAVSYSSGDMKAKGASTASMDAWTVAAYGGADVQYFRLDGALFYNGYSTDAERAFGTPGTAKTSPSGYAWGGSLQVSLPLFRGLVTPYLRGVLSRQHLDASVETGSPLLNLRYNAINGNYFVGDLGFRIDPLRSHPESKTKLFFTLALEHDFSALGEKVVGTFPVDNGQAWSSYWRGDSENTGVVGIDVARQITDKLEIAGRVNGRFSLFQTSGELALNAKYRF
jgi:hypothetical protein